MRTKRKKKKTKSSKSSYAKYFKDIRTLETKWGINVWSPREDLESRLENLEFSLGVKPYPDFTTKQRIDRLFKVSKRQVECTKKIKVLEDIYPKQARKPPLLSASESGG